MATDTYMAKSKSLNALFMVIMLLLLAINAKAASVTVTSPNGGECLVQGATFTITWTQTNVDHAAIYYTTDGGVTTPTFGSWFFMFNSGDPSTSHDWVVPLTVDSDTVRIWVEGHDAGHTQRLAIDSSDSNFMIKPSCSTPDTTAPNVSITSPLNGATISGTSVTITATASDNVGVVGVQFKLDSQNLGSEDTSSPYSSVLDTTTIADGTHTITAVARDAVPNTATSLAISVNVSNADTTAPTISSVSSSSITSSSAIITWSTNELSDTQADYGTSASYGLSSTLGTTLMTSHSVNLSGLTTGTLYHYRVKSKDAAGNLATSGDFTFTTIMLDTTPPVRSTGLPEGTLTSGTTSTTLSLTTNEAATCKYSTTLGIAYASMSNAFTTTGSTSHSVSITGLTNGAFNYYVRCIDTAGNANPNDFIITFSIANSSDTTPPVISLVLSSLVAGNGTTITWSTNENSNSQVDYGFTDDYGNSTTVDASLVTSHSQTLSGLLSYALYHYRVKSRDAAGNLAASNDSTFTTLDVLPPAVSINAPANNTIVFGTITITSIASDNSGIAGVQFAIDGTNRGAEDTTAPYNISWDTATSSNGNHTLTAVARDLAGNLASSELIITVFNGPNNNTSNNNTANNTSDGNSSTNNTNSSNEKLQETVNETAISLKLGKINSGSGTDLPINSSRSAVKKLTVEVKKLVANAEFTIEDLGIIPLNIPPPSKNVYKYLQMSTSIAYSDISKATIQFKVPASWVQTNNIKEKEIVLFHYENKLWNPLSTAKIGVEGNNLIYQAVTLGFSTFAIGAKDTAPAETPPSVQNNATGTKKKSNKIYWIIAAITLPILISLGFLKSKIAENRKREQIIMKLRVYASTYLRRGYTLQQIRDVLIKNKFNNEDIEEATRLYKQNNN